MNKTNYFNNGQEFNAYYPSGIVPSNELGVVGSYNSIYSFIKDVFGIEGGDPLQAYIDITSNSNVDVSTYAYAYVNVPIPSGYIQPSGTKSITSNGTSDVTTYASVNVNVPIPSGYIVPAGTKSITSNGTVDITTYANVNVAVPASAVVSGTKSITTNGTSDVTNYASVNVNVPIPSGYIQPSGTKSITANGTGIDVTAYASVDVAVPASGITPTGTYNITANGTYDVTSYANAYVNVPSSGPVLNWQTIPSSNVYPYGVGEIYLELTPGVTYVFKSNVETAVKYIGIDTDASGTIDFDDDYKDLGIISSNQEFYFTAINEFKGQWDTTAFILFGGLHTEISPAPVIQYAVLS